MVASMLLANLAATLFMTGLVWFVQVVHYPLMAGVGNGGYCAYHKSHMQRITWIVLPAMVLEALSAFLLAAFPTPETLRWPLCMGAGLVVLLWTSTWALQVPCHERLARAFMPDEHRRLIQTNWLRTFLWSARSLLMIFLIWLHFGHL